MIFKIPIYISIYAYIGNIGWLHGFHIRWQLYSIYQFSSFSWWRWWMNSLWKQTVLHNCNVTANNKRFKQQVFHQCGWFYKLFSLKTNNFKIFPSALCRRWKFMKYYFCYRKAIYVLTGTQFETGCQLGNHPIWK